MTNKHNERVEDEKYTSHEAIKEWEAEKDQNGLTQNIVTLLGIHGMHCMFYKFENASHITKAFESLFHTHTKEVREQTLAEVREFVNARMGGDIAATAQFPDSPEHKYAYDYLVQNRRELIELLDTLENKN